MADYPTTLPSFAANGANLSTAPHSALHTDLNQEVVAIATTLGTSPQGTLSTVKARLDKIAPYTGALTNWTPTCTQLGAVPLSIFRATWYRSGRQVTVNFYVNVTGAGGTAANPVLIGPLPAAAHASAVSMAVGSGYLFDNSGPGTYTFVAALQDTTTLKLLQTNGNAGDNRLGVSTPFNVALAANDLITATVNYEAAAD